MEAVPRLSVSDYRRHAQASRDTAFLLSNEPEKALWLIIAEEWDRMAEEADGGHDGGQLAQQPGVVPPASHESNSA